MAYSRDVFSFLQRYTYCDEYVVARHYYEVWSFFSGSFILYLKERIRSSSMEAKTFESHVLSKVYEEMQRRYEGFDDPAHGWEHIKRVYKLALYIAEHENADAFI